MPLAGCLALYLKWPNDQSLFYLNKLAVLETVTLPGLTCRDDVEGAGLQLLAQVVGRPAEDGAVVQLVEGGVDQLGLSPILTEASVLRW